MKTKIFLVLLSIIIISGCSSKPKPGHEIEVAFLNISTPVKFGQEEMDNDSYIRNVQKYEMKQRYGDAIFINTGQHTIMIDGGMFSRGRSVVIPFLKQNNVTQIDTAVITHQHADHYGGIYELIKDFKVNAVVTNGMTHAARAYKKLLELIKEKKVNYLVAKRGDVFNWGDNVKAEVLKSHSNIFGDHYNNQSVVIKMVYNEISFMFTGDAEIEAERYLISKYKDKLKSTILKVGHHGSATASSFEFLKYVKPEAAVLSVEKGNVHGLPKAVILERYKGLKIPLYATYDYGTVKVFTDGVKYRFETEKIKNKKDNEEEVHFSEKYLKMMSEGWNAIRQKKYYRAVKFYEKAAAIEPKSAKAYSQLGYALKKAKRYIDAEKSLLKAIELNDRDQYAHLHLGLLYMYNKPEKARYHLEKYIYLVPDGRWVKLAEQKLSELE